jgi:hypothetical protein
VITETVPLSRIVTIVEQPARETGAVDFLLGALSLAGALGLLSVLVGLLVGALFIWFRNARPDNSFNGQASEQYCLKLDGAAR